MLADSLTWGALDLVHNLYAVGDLEVLEKRACLIAHRGAGPASAHAQRARTTFTVRTCRTPDSTSAQHTAARA
jgi:hypothetical protein